MGKVVIPIEARFWSKVDSSGGPDACWPWMAYVASNGYGKFRIGVRRGAYAHRMAYRLAIGEIPDGLTIDHVCRTRSCCNPRHLEPVTLAENLRRGNGSAAVNARKTMCDHGHPLGGDNLYVERLTGKRHCRECRRATMRRFYAHHPR